MNCLCCHCIAFTLTLFFLPQDKEIQHLKGVIAEKDAWIDFTQDVKIGTLVEEIDAFKEYCAGEKNIIDVSWAIFLSITKKCVLPIYIEAKNLQEQED